MKFSRIQALFCICALILITQASAVTDNQKEDLENLYDGLFEQAGLQDPSTVVNCYDATSTNLTLIFFGNFFSDLANNKEVQALVDVQQYERHLSANVPSCLKQNQEFQNLVAAYNIQGKSFIEIGSAILKMIGSDYKGWRETLLSLDADYHEGQYQESGKIVGVLIQKAFPSAAQVTVTDNQKEDLEEVYDGLFEQAGLDDPTTVINCYDANSTNLTLTFLGRFFSDLANDKQVQAFADVQQYEKQLPSTVSSCLKQNEEFQNMAKAYHIQGKSIIIIGSAILKMVASDYDGWRETLLSLDADFHEGKYQESGEIMGKLIQKAFPSSNDETVTDNQKEDLEAIYDGLFEEASLQDPTNVINCYDASSTNLTLTFLGRFFSDLANDKQVQAFADVQQYEKNLPTTVTSCLKQNQEYQSMLKAYHIQGKSGIQIGSAILKMVASDYDGWRETLLSLDADFHEAQYQECGFIMGELIQKAFPTLIDEDILQMF